MKLPHKYRQTADWERQAVDALSDADARLRAIESLDAGTRLDALEALNAGSRLDALEDIDAGTRLDALEAVNADSRLTTLEAVDADNRLNAVEAATDFSALDDYTDDSAAASGGVGVGELYRTGSAVKVRIA